jgi:hypothetical protein
VNRRSLPAMQRLDVEVQSFFIAAGEHF